jgi:hypothetical protein
MTLSIMTISIMTLSLMTFSIMTLSIMTLSIKTLSIKTLSLTTLSIMMFSLMSSIMTLSTSDTHQNNTRHKHKHFLFSILNVAMLSKMAPLKCIGSTKEHLNKTSSLFQMQAERNRLRMNLGESPIGILTTAKPR